MQSPPNISIEYDDSDSCWHLSPYIPDSPLYMTYLPQVEKPAAGLTPTLQHDMRTTQGKNMKRGRKAKRGKATKRTKKVKSTTKRTKGLKHASTPAPRPKAARDSPVASSKRKLQTLRKMKSPTKLSSLSLPDEHAETYAKPKAKAAKKRNKACWQSQQETQDFSTRSFGRGCVQQLAK